ncbi:MAG: FkbM family methyltransferase [Bacteroides sp.]|nr:FkbM family methyltransferase [Eubacterium sp.]MCM1418351.1 FkbM family methyltransferase [Roseburia sp.]MCM1462833.1 FkbM family methyltransferase [Bacteroides sp.]
MDEEILEREEAQERPTEEQPPAEKPAIKTVWERLASTEKPIVLYGMGDGADKILAVMAEKGIRPAEFMASDEFVRGQSFHGYRVKKLAEIEAEYDDFFLVICFGSAIPEVMERIARLAERYETVAPDVPVVGGGLFDGAYLTAHESEIKEVRALFADDRSREIFDALVYYRLTGEISALKSAETAKDEALALLKIGTREIYMDLGAYDGDTVEAFLRLTDKKFEKIYAVEPDRRNYSRMRRRLYSLGSGVFSHYNAAVTEEDGEVVLSRRANRGTAVVAENPPGDTPSQKRERTETVDGRSVDSILNGGRATLIKYDVEGSEAAALRGSAATIAKYKPRLIVSLYHRTEDLVALPLLVRELNPAYKLYLRHHPYIPAWDTNLYCI